MLLNTKGAANKLGCSITWIHKLVAQGKIRAYVYNENGVLVVHKPERSRQGYGLYFEENELEYEPGVQRRPRGSKDKVKNNPNRKKTVYP